MSAITSLSGRCVPLRGNDIDTDRIIPARYLRCVTFDGLGEHAFEDDRAQLKAQGQTHAFDQAPYQGAEILLVGSNFGCGSSREHAPQAIQKWGIKAIIGVSYSEIFFGNTVAMGMPCLRVSPADIEKLWAAVEADPNLSVSVSLADQKVVCGTLTVPCQMAEGPRTQFLTGQWDATGGLLDGLDAVRATASKVPYLVNFA
jgi:3-isopropylmalate/(R)-2-methylmalate dehydratase small subunit